MNSQLTSAARAQTTTCPEGTHQFLIGRDFGKSCLCGVMMMNQSGKVLPRAEPEADPCALHGDDSLVTCDYCDSNDVEFTRDHRSYSCNDCGAVVTG